MFQLTDRVRNTNKYQKKERQNKKESHKEYIEKKKKTVE